MIGIQARLVQAKMTAEDKLQGAVRRFAGDTSGATAIEYGLIAAGVAVAVIAVVFALGDEISNTFQDVNNNIKDR